MMNKRNHKKMSVRQAIESVTLKFESQRRDRITKEIEKMSFRVCLADRFKIFCGSFEKGVDDFTGILAGTAEAEKINLRSILAMYPVSKEATTIYKEMDKNELGKIHSGLKAKIKDEGKLRHARLTQRI